MIFFNSGIYFNYRRIINTNISLMDIMHKYKDIVNIYN